MGFPDEYLDTIRVEVVNQSEHPVQIAKMGIKANEVICTAAEEQIPKTLDPHHGGTVDITHEAAKRQNIDLSQPILGWAELATKEQFESEPFSVPALPDSVSPPA